MVYLDDGIVAAEGKATALGASKGVKEDLSKAGFVAHIGKSHWGLTRNIIWLGFVLDLRERKIKVPKAKLVGVQEILRNVKVKEKVSAKYLASLIGKIMALSIVVNPVARLMTRSLYAVLNSKAWFQKLDISPGEKDKLMLWQECLPRLQGQNIWQSPSVVRVIYFDTSGMGYAGYTVEHSPAIVHGQWSHREAE